MKRKAKTQRSVQLDCCGTEGKIAKFANASNCTYRIVEAVGPAGHPLVEFSGEKVDILDLINAYSNDDDEAAMHAATIK